MQPAQPPHTHVHVHFDSYMMRVSLGHSLPLVMTQGAAKAAKPIARQSWMRKSLVTDNDLFNMDFKVRLLGASFRGRPLPCLFVCLEYGTAARHTLVPLIGPPRP